MGHWSSFSQMYIHSFVLLPVRNGTHRNKELVSTNKQVITEMLLNTINENPYVPVPIPH